MMVLDLFQRVRQRTLELSNLISTSGIPGGLGVVLSGIYYSLVYFLIEQLKTSHLALDTSGIHCNQLHTCRFLNLASESPAPSHMLFMIIIVVGTLGLRKYLRSTLAP